MPVVQAFNTSEGKMGAGEMEVEVEEGVGVSECVTVLLVSMSTMDQGNAAKRRRLGNGCERPADEPAELLLGSIHADSSKLRECSKYFATCMSGRWANHATPREFRLEAHTEVRFYEECFGRMYFPYKAIENVGECIELLKVASQIGFAQVLDIGVKYLAAVTWSIEEEKQIRSFCDSGQISLGSKSDLRKRLHFGSNAREREEIHLKRTHRVLNGYLQLSLRPYHSHRETESRRMFEEAFQATISGLGPGKCGKILPMVLTLVTKESEKLLRSFKEVLKLREFDIFTIQITNFCWLFNTVRSSNAGQVILKQILKYKDIAPPLQKQIRKDSARLRNTPIWQFEWNSMICTIFEDILEGRLLLTTSQRLAFFKHWNGFFKIGNKPDCPLETMLVYRFILTLPHEDQEKIYHHWVSLRDDQEKKAAQYDLTEAHSLWIKHLVSQPEILAEAPECSSTGWRSEPANGESSGCETALP
ncbi:hypothetical protein KC19_6G181200 [Ceratodon purpureus]|uniref:Uncharacterized protein n=1 Tax=Ceratodon purpureus TaxID=3225 RepID=A0A8T0HHJ8_CERPU|nr:hypothetical protein KC19_6G181200 [Ceratodon purpureus]